MKLTRKETIKRRQQKRRAAFDAIDIGNINDKIKELANHLKIKDPGSFNLGREKPTIYHFVATIVWIISGDKPKTSTLPTVVLEGPKTPNSFFLEYVHKKLYWIIQDYVLDPGGRLLEIIEIETSELQNLLVVDALRKAANLDEGIPTNDFETLPAPEETRKTRGRPKKKTRLDQIGMNSLSLAEIYQGSRKESDNCVLRSLRDWAQLMKRIKPNSRVVDSIIKKITVKNICQILNVDNLINGISAEQIINHIAPYLKISVQIYNFNHGVCVGQYIHPYFRLGICLLSQEGDHCFFNPVISRHTKFDSIEMYREEFKEYTHKFFRPEQSSVGKELEINGVTVRSIKGSSKCKYCNKTCRSFKMLVEHEKECHLGEEHKLNFYLDLDHFNFEEIGTQEFYKYVINHIGFANDNEIIKALKRTLYILVPFNQTLDCKTFCNQLLRGSPLDDPMMIPRFKSNDLNWLEMNIDYNKSIVFFKSHVNVDGHKKLQEAGFRKIPTIFNINDWFRRQYLPDFTESVLFGNLFDQFVLKGRNTASKPIVGAFKVPGFDIDAISSEDVYYVDGIRQYTTVGYNFQTPFGNFNSTDDFEPYDGHPIDFNTKGSYLVDVEEIPLLTSGLDTYDSHKILNFQEEGIPYTILAQGIPKCCRPYPTTYFQKFEDQVYRIVPDHAKNIINTFWGCMGVREQEYYDNGRLFRTKKSFDDYRAMHPNKTRKIVLKNFDETGHGLAILIRVIPPTLRHRTNLPLHYKLIQESNTRLYHTAKKYGGILLGCNVDALIIYRPNITTSEEFISESGRKYGTRIENEWFKKPYRGSSTMTNWEHFKIDFNVVNRECV